MNKERQKEFTLRISQANKTELVVITYDIILLQIEEAIKAFEMGDNEKGRSEIDIGQKCIMELINTLDFEYEISKELFSLYIFANKILLRSKRNYRRPELQSTYNVLKKLQDGFIQIRHADESKPLMCNTQSVYAGLTYGKNELNETYMEFGNRGFLA